MQYKNSAIVLSKNELKCLLAFAAKSGTTACITLGLRDKQVVAYASAGDLCVRATAETDAACSSGCDWVIPKESAEHVYRALKGDQDAHFTLGDKQVISRAAIWEVAEDGTNIPCGHRTLPSDVAAQTVLFKDRVAEYQRKAEADSGKTQIGAQLPKVSWKPLGALFGAADASTLEFLVPSKPSDPLAVVATGSVTIWEALVAQDDTADDVEKGDGPLFDKSKLAGLPVEYHDNDCTPHGTATLVTAEKAEDYLLLDDLVAGEDVPEDEHAGPAAMSLDAPPPKPAVVQGPSRRGRKGGK